MGVDNYSHCKQNRVGICPTAHASLCILVAADLTDSHYEN